MEPTAVSTPACGAVTLACTQSRVTAVMTSTRTSAAADTRLPPGQGNPRGRDPVPGQQRLNAGAARKPGTPTSDRSSGTRARGSTELAGAMPGGRTARLGPRAEGPVHEPAVIHSQCVEIRRDAPGMKAGVVTARARNRAERVETFHSASVLRKT